MNVVERVRGVNRDRRGTTRVRADCPPVPPPPDADPLAPLRAQWLDWMRARLPAAARNRPDWPIRLDHCFGRVILDAVYDRPWREVLRSPA